MRHLRAPRMLGLFKVRECVNEICRNNTKKLRTVYVNWTSNKLFYTDKDRCQSVNLLQLTNETGFDIFTGKKSARKQKLCYAQCFYITRQSDNNSLSQTQQFSEL